MHLVHRVWQGLPVKQGHEDLLVPLDNLEQTDKLGPRVSLATLVYQDLMVNLEQEVSLVLKVQLVL